MKTDNQQKKKTAEKYAVIHIDAEVHQDLKVYCATRKKSLYEHATEALKKSMKN